VFESTFQSINNRGQAHFSTNLILKFQRRLPKPIFASRAMGYPDDWLEMDGEHLEMQSSRKSRKPSSTE
jgi:hypothetical protein